MRVAVIGLPTSGKSTVFKALTGVESANAAEATHVVEKVPDERIDKLSDIYQPKKTIYATIEFIDLGQAAQMRKDAGELGPKFLSEVRPAHALIHVVDGFSVVEEIDQSVQEAIELVDTELLLCDLDVCQKRIERLRKEGAKTGPAQQELQLLTRVADWLSASKPLRTETALCNEEKLKSYSFLSAKPIITVVNTDESSPDWQPDNLPDPLRNARSGPNGRFVSLCGQIESEIKSLAPEDARAFLADYGLKQPARERVIQECYTLLGLSSFFTVGKDEVRAWTILKNARAQDAAAAVHSDMARGFIRAEVVDFNTAIELGGFEDAKKQGKIRLEGRDYPVQDGDIISYRFNI